MTTYPPAPSPEPPRPLPPGEGTYFSFPMTDFAGSIWVLAGCTRIRRRCASVRQVEVIDLTMDPEGGWAYYECMSYADKQISFPEIDPAKPARRNTLQRGCLT